MLKNVSAYLQSRKELHSSVFEEIHEHRFFLKKEFVQPILYGNLLKEKLTLLNMLKL